MSNIPTSVRAIAGVICTVLVVAATLIATSSIERTAANRGYERTQTAQALLNTMLDRDTGLRGFLETGDEALLAPYVRGTKGFQAAVRAGARLADEVPSAQPALNAQIASAAGWQQAAVAAIERVRSSGLHHLSFKDALARKRALDAFRTANARYLATMNKRRISDLSHATTLSTWIVVALSLLLALSGLLLVRLNSNHERRAREALRAIELRRDERERVYVEARRRFAEVVQVSETEAEARELIKNRIETGLSGSSVVVLNRNNSADRLEAATQIDEQSPLYDALTNAKPRSCLAIRLGRQYEEDARDGASAVSCEICGKTDSRTLCEPLLVGGEVIGSLLIAHEDDLDDHARRLISETVTYSAPVLANLRNLAIAERRAHTDALTGLPNRRALDDTFKLLLAQAARAVTPLSVMLIDLDRFKDVNDTFGHDRGDQVLAAVATALAESVRTSDFAARMGGEEFLVLLPNTNSSGAAKVADTIAGALARAPVHDIDRNVTASFGVACFPDHGVDVETLLRSADRALYQAKSDGRDCVRFALKAAQPEKDAFVASDDASDFATALDWE